MVPFSFGCGSAVLAASATLAPSRAARNAIASPMPRLAPDTNSVLPLRDVISPTPVVSTVGRQGLSLWERRTLPLSQRDRKTSILAYGILPIRMQDSATRFR